jgi:hypothetical protein
LTLFPQSLDEYISEDNPARFIDAFVEGLDPEAFGFSHSVLPGLLGQARKPVALLIILALS